MFLDFFQMRQQPFGVTPDPAYLYPSANHREALGSLSDGIKEGRGFMALIAPPGMGKTTLLYQLLDDFHGSACTAFLFQTLCDSREFFQYLLGELRIDSRGMDVVAMHAKLNEVLFAEMIAGRRFVLIVDEAQNLSDSVLETVRMLSNFETSHTKLLQIVLAGQPQLAEKLSQPHLLQLRQRIAVLTHLEPLSESETACYIDHRLRVAGYSGAPLFAADALRLIADHSEGIPRSINNICHAALAAACSRDERTVTSEVVRKVAEKLNVDWAVRPTANARRAAPPEAAAVPVVESAVEKVAEPMEVPTPIPYVFPEPVATALVTGAAATPEPVAFEVVELAPLSDKMHDPVAVTASIPSATQEAATDSSPIFETTEPLGSDVIEIAALHEEFVTEILQSVFETASPEAAEPAGAQVDAPTVVEAAHLLPYPEPSIPALVEPVPAVEPLASEAVAPASATPHFHTQPSFGLAVAAVFKKFRHLKWDFRATIVMSFLLASGLIFGLIKFMEPSQARAASLARQKAALLKGSDYSADPQEIGSAQIVTVAAMPQQTIKDIATLYIGHFDSQVLTEIQLLNPGIKDPDHLQPGQLIRLPFPRGSYRQGSEISEQP